MKITIDTKFNIGDRIYAADHYYDYYTSHMPYIISDIIIKMDGRRTQVTYCVDRGSYTDHFPEEWCFGTYEECAKWCAEHN